MQCAPEARVYVQRRRRQDPQSLTRFRGSGSAHQCTSLFMHHRAALLFYREYTLLDTSILNHTNFPCCNWYSASTFLARRLARSPCCSSVYFFTRNRRLIIRHTSSSANGAVRMTVVRLELNRLVFGTYLARSPGIGFIDCGSRAG
jgi:hypothetical protein